MQFSDYKPYTCKRLVKGTNKPLNFTASRILTITLYVSFNFLIQEDVKHENFKTGFQSK